MIRPQAARRAARRDSDAIWRRSLIVTLAFQNGLEDCNFDFSRVIGNHFCTPCGILVTFIPETQEFALLTIAHFAALWQKSAYRAKHLRMSWTYLYLLYRFGRRIGGDNCPNIRLAVAQRNCVLAVKFGRCSQTSRGTTFSLCSGVWQRIGRS